MFGSINKGDLFPKGAIDPIWLMAFKEQIAMKMKEHVLSQAGGPLGDSPTGADWALKALHPADPLVEVRGIPDESAVPSVFVNYQTVARVGAAAGVTAPWSYDGVLMPHPVQFMSHKVTDEVGTVESATLNVQLTGSTAITKYANFRAEAKRWRLAYMSVTIHQDGPDLANQGTIVVSQVPVRPRMYNASWLATPVLGAPEARFIVGPHMAMFDDLDRPSYAASQAMPNAYFNQSKHGAYVPLKLTRTCQEWHSDSDSMAIVGYSTVNDPDGSGVAFNQGFATLTGVDGDTWPFGGGLGAATVSVPVGTSYADASSTFLTSPLCNDVWAHISAQNLSPQTSLSMFIRVGFELQVGPTSLLSPHQKLSPPHDPRAIDSYFRIARELKDAYPEDFNGLGKILNTIGDVAQFLAPALNLVPGVGGLLSKAASVGGKYASAWGRQKEAERIMSDADIQHTASLGDVERAKARKQINADLVQAVTSARLQQANRTVAKRKPKPAKGKQNGAKTAQLVRLLSESLA